eukprot:429835-Pelagomonas_calceolata.AAC.2
MPMSKFRNYSLSAIILLSFSFLDLSSFSACHQKYDTSLSLNFVVGNSYEPQSKEKESPSVQEHVRQPPRSKLLCLDRVRDPWVFFSLQITFITLQIGSFLYFSPFDGGGSWLFEPKRLLFLSQRSPGGKIYHMSVDMMTSTSAHYHQKAANKGIFPDLHLKMT